MKLSPSGVQNTLFGPGVTYSFPEKTIPDWSPEILIWATVQHTKFSTAVHVDLLACIHTTAVVLTTKFSSSTTSAKYLVLFVTDFSFSYSCIKKDNSHDIMCTSEYRY